jgi:hypothetical protein
MSQRQTAVKHHLEPFGKIANFVERSLTTHNTTNNQRTPSQPTSLTLILLHGRVRVGMAETFGVLHTQH